MSYDQDCLDTFAALKEQMRKLGPVPAPLPTIENAQARIDHMEKMQALLQKGYEKAIGYLPTEVFNAWVDLRVFNHSLIMGERKEDVPQRETGN